MSPNAEMTSRVRRNNEVSGDRSGTIHQSTKATPAAVRHLVTVPQVSETPEGNTVLVLLYQLWALASIKMVKSVLRFNSSSIYEVVRRNIMITTVSHDMIGLDMLHFVRGFSLQFTLTFLFSLFWLLCAFL